MKLVRWFLDHFIGTSLTLVVLLAGGSAFATSWDVLNEPQMNLDVQLTPTQTTGVVLASPQLNGANHVFATTSGGVLRIRFGTFREDIYYASATRNATTNKVTLSGVIRNICPQYFYSIVTCGNGRSWGKGAIVEVVQDARLFNLKANIDRANTFTAKNSIRFSGSGSLGQPTFATTAARDQQLGATPSTGSGLVACVVATGLCYDGLGGTWVARGANATPNASETEAGKFQVTSYAHLLSRTMTGATGALNALTPRWLAKNATGSTSAGLIPQLGSDGKLSTTFLNSPVGPGFFGDGSDGSVTISTATTLTRDMMYSTLTVNTGAYINTAGFRVFVNGTLTLYGTTGAIVRNGNDGGNGTAAVTTTPGAGGASGAVLADGFLMGGVKGSMGGRGGLTVNNGDGAAGIAGNPGTLQGKAVGSNGAIGVAGGTGGQDDDASGSPGAGGGAGAAGTVSLHPATYGTFRFLEAASTNRLQTTTGSVVFYVNAASGGGGGGGGGSCNGEGSNSAGAGGGGGGSGGNAGVNVVIAKLIRGTGLIQAKGGAGGAGGAGAAASSTCGGGGGGAGGSGGNGGLVVLVYGSSNWTGSVSVAGGAGGSGGAAGAGGTGAQPGSAGTTGTTGVSGVALTFVLSQ